MKIFKLLNTGQVFPAGLYLRFWMQPGVPLSLHDGLVAWVHEDVVDDERQLFLHLKDARHELVWQLRAGSYIDAFDVAPCKIMPRAVEMDGAGRCVRVMVDLSRQLVGALGACDG